MVDEEKGAELHKLGKGLDTGMTKAHEFLHELIAEAPLFHPVPEFILRDVLNDVLLIDPIEFLDIEDRPRDANPLWIKCLNELVDRVNFLIIRHTIAHQG